MFAKLLFFVLFPFISSRRPDRTFEAQPFVTSNDIFSRSLDDVVQTFTEDQLERELQKVIGPPSTKGPSDPASLHSTVDQAPSFTPQPPAAREDEIKETQRNIENSSEEKNSTEVKKETKDVGTASVQSRSTEDGYPGVFDDSAVNALPTQEVEETSQPTSTTSESTSESSFTTQPSYDIDAAFANSNIFGQESATQFPAESSSPTSVSPESSSTTEPSYDVNAAFANANIFGRESATQFPVESSGKEIEEGSAEGSSLEESFSIEENSDENDGSESESSGAGAGSGFGPIFKISGEVGTENDVIRGDFEKSENENSQEGSSSEIEEKGKNDAVSVETSLQTHALVQSILNGIPSNTSSDQSETTPNISYSLDDAAVVGDTATDANLSPPVSSCPTPLLCPKNCFVSLDYEGCQTCECLWQSLPCESDLDCPEEMQHCDLGKCNCRSGFEQDMSQSGKCKKSNTTEAEVDQLPSLGVDRNSANELSFEPINFSTASRETTTTLPKFSTTKFPYGANAYFGVRVRAARSVPAATRSIRAAKPRDATRLQWPGDQ